MLVRVGLDNGQRAMRRKVTALIAVAAAAAVWSGVAQAGYAVGPPSGATTSAQPTFTVFLEPQEQPLAHVWVAADTQMESNYIPVRDLGSCVPSTPTSA